VISGVPRRGLRPSASTTSKRLLAYHSIENIGIIVMGVGLAPAGAARWGRVRLGRPRPGGRVAARLEPRPVQGSCCSSAPGLGHPRHAHTRERSTTWAAWPGPCRGRRACFLVGAVAICGLPPAQRLRQRVARLPGGCSTPCPASVTAHRTPGAALARPCSGPHRRFLALGLFSSRSSVRSSSEAGRSEPRRFRPTSPARAIITPMPGAGRLLRVHRPGPRVCRARAGDWLSRPGCQRWPNRQPASRPWRRWRGVSQMGVALVVGPGRHRGPLRPVCLPTLWGRVGADLGLRLRGAPRRALQYTSFFPFAQMLVDLFRLGAADPRPAAP